MHATDAAGRVRAARRRPLFDAAEVAAVDLDRSAIERVLPHRRSMLLLDRITGLDVEGGRAVGRRRIDPTDPVFEGHFPDNPLYPGVLQVEMAGQLGLYVAMRAHAEAAGAADGLLDVRLTRVGEVAFSAPLQPAAEVVVLAEVLDDDGYLVSCLGQLLHGDAVVCAATFDAMILERGT